MGGLLLKMISRVGRRNFRSADFLSFVDTEEEVVGQGVAVMETLVAILHVHICAPRQPEGLLSVLKADRPIVDLQMIASERERTHGLEEIGFDAQHVVAGGGNPDATLDADVVSGFAVVPAANAGGGILFLFKTDLPGSLAAKIGEAFALVVETLAIGGLEKSDAKTVDAGGDHASWKSGIAGAAIAAFFEVERIASVGIDEDDVGKLFFLGRFGQTGALDFLVDNVFGGGEFLEVEQLRVETVLGEVEDFVGLAGDVAGDGIFHVVDVGGSPRRVGIGGRGDV